MRERMALQSDRRAKDRSFLANIPQECKQKDSYTQASGFHHSAEDQGVGQKIRQAQRKIPVLYLNHAQK